MNEFLTKFPYDQIREILKKFYQYNSYDEYIQNLELIESNKNFLGVISTIKGIPVSLSQQIKLLPEKKFIKNNNNLFWPVNFCFIHK